MKRLIVLVALGGLVIYGVSTILKSPDAPSAASTGDHATGTVEIAPAHAFASSTLHLQLAGGSRALDGACRWFKNGEEIAGVTTSTMDPGQFRKGDSIEAEATLESGAVVRAPAVRILNSPPRIVAASANLRPDPSTELYVEVSAVDADNDDISYRYTWFVNGKQLPNETGSTLEVSKVGESDKVYATVVATDGEDESSPEMADRIEIRSSVPVINSVPPQALDQGRFVYQVKTTMPGAKNLRYQLVTAPEGMTINGTGRIEWAVPAGGEPQGYNVEVRVSDPNGGEASQRFQISTTASDSTR